MRFIYPLLVSFLLYATCRGQTPQIKWWFDTNDSGFGSAAAGDLDGDGYLEIIFGCYRNDGSVYTLNAEDGSLLWTRDLAGDFEGCNDVAPIIYDVDGDGDLEAVVPASCNPRTFCFDGETGQTVWETLLHGSDSPPTISDVDGDGKPEILHGNFGGWVTCLNAEDGSVVYELPVDLSSWIQTAPTILDADLDGNLDFFVAASSFDGPDKFFCYRADNQQLLWESNLAEDDFYHGASVADLDADGYKELVIGNYDGQIYCLNAEDGSLHWQYAFPDFFYTPMATSIADLNSDNKYEIIFFDFNRVGALNHEGQLLWEFEIANFGQCFRGAAISDVTGDGMLDIIFASSNGIVYALHGNDGSLAFEVNLSAHYGQAEFALDHGPIIADFDKDGYMDIFVVGGHTLFPEFQNNYGRAYAISTHATGGPDWLMFRKDSVRSGHLPIEETTHSSTIDSPIQISLGPNPTSGLLYINFHLDEPSEILISLVNEQGQFISHIEKDNCRSGEHQIEYNLPAGIGSGVYYVKVSNNHLSTYKKLIISNE